jgi:hypothetical protein
MKALNINEVKQITANKRKADQAWIEDARNAINLAILEAAHDGRGEVIVRRSKLLQSLPSGLHPSTSATVLRCAVLPFIKAGYDCCLGGLKEWQPHGLNVDAPLTAVYANVDIIRFSWDTP